MLHEESIGEWDMTKELLRDLKGGKSSGKARVKQNSCTDAQEEAGECEKNELSWEALIALISIFGVFCIGGIVCCYCWKTNCCKCRSGCIRCCPGCCGHLDPDDDTSNKDEEEDVVKVKDTIKDRNGNEKAVVSVIGPPGTWAKYDNN